MPIIDLKDAPQHLPTLAKWHHQQWADLNPGFSLEQRLDMMQAYLGDYPIPSTYVAVDTEPMGSAALIANDMDSHPEWTPWLASVFVAPAYRNQGIGGRLVRHAMDRAKAAGIAGLYLFTPDREDFYRRLGWRVLATEHYRGHAVTIMHADLSDSFI